MIVLALFMRDHELAYREARPVIEAAIRAAGVPAEAGVASIETPAPRASRLRRRRGPYTAIVADGADTGIRFHGVLRWRALQALAAAMRLAAGADPGLPPAARMRVRELVELERLRLVVSFYDPRALDLVRAVSQVAIASPLVQVDIVDADAVPGGARGPEVVAGGLPLALPADGVALGDALLRARCWHPAGGAARAAE